MSENEKFSADSLPCSPQAKQLEDFKKGGFNIVLPIKCHVLVATLLSKFKVEGISTLEFLILWEAWEKLMEKSNTDKLFYAKHKLLVRISTLIVLNYKEGLRYEDFSEKLNQLPEGKEAFKGLLSPRRWYGMRAAFEHIIFVRRKKLEPAPRTPSRIAVGYKDKGTSRKIHLDGSQPWQEIAMDEHFQENVEIETPKLELSEFIRQTRLSVEDPTSVYFLSEGTQPASETELQKTNSESETRGKLADLEVSLESRNPLCKVHLGEDGEEGKEERS